MRIPVKQPALFFLAVLVLVLLSACRTLDYRQVQTQFHEAVQADNSGMPLARQHHDVVERLTPEYISQLDPKLRPNAWTLRAVSAWRAGFTNIPESSARSGLAEPHLVPGSRDDIVLSMVPALAVDSDLLRRWLAANREVADAYEAVFEPGFRGAWTALDGVAGRMNQNTPVDARAYFHYHRWRILQNWMSVIGHLPTQLRIDANTTAASIVGKNLLAAAEQERDGMPPAHPLRALIRAQGGQ